MAAAASSALPGCHVGIHVPGVHPLCCCSSSLPHPPPLFLPAATYSPATLLSIADSLLLASLTNFLLSLPASLLLMMRISLAVCYASLPVNVSTSTWVQLCNAVEQLQTATLIVQVCCSSGTPIALRACCSAYILPIRLVVPTCGVSPDCEHCCRLCHPDDPRHLTLECLKPCTHELQPCGHPCRKLCHETCGPCTHPIPETLLPCGHTALNLPCWK